ncbi:MAG: S-methyl-5-thioribose-1-phosphate isomerase [Candidatus ainarchaeum sp.]|nr:S-methyl-5-thioribose-1-phosphate isomerase [Candidatus ainarchaeum sp.]
MNIISKTVKDLKSLKIQGATNVRKKSLSAIVKVSMKSKAKNEDDFRKEFLKNAEKVFYARPTEPELRTSLRVVKKNISQKGLSVNEMKKIIKNTVFDYDKNRKIAIEKMSGFGAELIKPDSTILTLCHSSTVVKTLIRAKKKINHVYCCETRPLFQGRITARELARAGIKVTLIVDNAASTVLKKCDYFFSGADSFLSDGDIINKIGTNQISIICKKCDTKHYVVLSTHKFEPSSFFGKDGEIEQRSKKEILDKSIKGVNILNPAFDRTNSSLIEGIICEDGVFPPQVLASKLYDKLKLDKFEKDFLKL